MNKFILCTLCVFFSCVGFVSSANAACYYSGQQQRDCEEQEARTEYLKREAELMKQKAEYLEDCRNFPSSCR